VATKFGDEGPSSPRFDAASENEEENMGGGGVLDIALHRLT
jgi:hypothetical protein